MDRRNVLANMVVFSKATVWICMAITLTWIVSVSEEDMGSFGARVYQGFMAELEK